MIASRRRVLTIMAAAAGAALPLGRTNPGASFAWTGTALGADARIVIAGLPRNVAENSVAIARNEADRLESAFSLYRSDSEISRLNRDGFLNRPSQDFRILLARAMEAWQATEGAFNPAIQPLWRFLAQHFSGTAESLEPSRKELKQLLALCDPSRLTVNGSRIEMAPSMALTFNGIAQGYITDQAAHLLEQRGLSNILIDLGEIYALPGKSWDIAIPGEERHVPLRQRALAHSAGNATRFTANGNWHHLLDPLTGHSANSFAAVTVLAPSATEADLLSTALFVATPERHRAILSRFPGAEAIVRRTPI